MNYIKNNESSCKGIYLKAYISQWPDSSIKHRYVVRQDTQLRIMKKMSCTGCGVCWGFWEYLGNLNSGEHFDLSKLGHGKIYSLVFVELGHDYDGGYVDDWEYVFEEVKNIEENKL